MKKDKTVYILKDDYAPDAGSRIYGVYSTYEKAEEAMEYYGNENEDYGEGCESLDICSFSLQ
jgi:hypothetical protein